MRTALYRSTWYAGITTCQKLEPVRAPQTITTTTTTKMKKPIPVYMILSAVGTERGQPLYTFFDPFLARATFDAMDVGLASAFTGNYNVFLIAYEIGEGGMLTEMGELGRK